MNLLVHTTLDAATFAGSLRNEIAKIDRAIPAPYIHAMDTVVWEAVAARRFQALLVTSFAGLALVLASMGIFGVVSYVVLQRRAEIGVRIALGATPGEVSVWMLNQGMRPTVLGLAVGVLMAAATTRFMSGLLFEVRALDPATFIAAPLLLAIIALLACYLPARRASQMDAMEALRDS